MSEETMTLSDDQLEQIGRYVQKNLPEWLRTLPPQTVQITDPALLERTVRVEEELRAQRELMIERFDAVDKRFEDMHKHFSRAEWLLGILVTMFMGLTTAIQIFG